jgi:hypothetical protein
MTTAVSGGSGSSNKAGEGEWKNERQRDLFWASCFLLKLNRRIPRDEKIAKRDVCKLFC